MMTAKFFCLAFVIVLNAFSAFCVQSGLGIRFKELSRKIYAKRVAFIDDEHIVLISKLSFANFTGAKISSK